LDHDPPTYASDVAGITDVNHHAQLLKWDEVLITFFPLGWHQTVILPISASQRAGITGMNHNAWPSFCLFFRRTITGPST
jgi:hypothetical protein